MSDTTRHTVDPKFVIPRQGKQMVLYVGLLDAAHRAGMVSMDTEILQFPSAANDQTCIVRAVVTLFKDEDHRGIYTGIGDANPKNVGGTIVPHFIRMAETRAKARALRDALNVGMVTVEELGGDDRDDEPASPLRALPTPARPASPAAPASAQEHPLLATIRDDEADPRKRRTALHNFLLTAESPEVLDHYLRLSRRGGMPDSDCDAAEKWHIDNRFPRAAPAPAATPPANHAG